MHVYENKFMCVCEIAKLYYSLDMLSKIKNRLREKLKENCASSKTKII